MRQGIYRLRHQRFRRRFIPMGVAAAGLVVTNRGSYHALEDVPVTTRGGYHALEDIAVTSRGGYHALVRLDRLTNRGTYHALLGRFVLTGGYHALQDIQVTNQGTYHAVLTLNFTFIMRGGYHVLLVAPEVFEVTDTNIFNIAASALAITEVDSINDATPHARRMKSVFPIIRDEMLFVHKFKSSVVVKELVQHLVEPVEDRWEKKFILPHNHIRSLQINDGAESFDIHGEDDDEGDFLYTNATSVKLQYIARRNVGSLHAAVQKAIGLALAEEVARHFVSEAAIAQIKESAFRALRRAKSADGKQASTAQLQDRTIPNYMKIGRTRRRI